MKPAQRKLVFLALAFATALKLCLAATSKGSLDVAGFGDHLDKIRELGAGAYLIRGAFNNPLNHPPPMVHVIRFWGCLADNSGVPFAFWLRLFPILADLGSLVVAQRIVERLVHPKDLFIVLLLLALNPVSILVSGYHGNTDSVMMFLVVLAIYLAGSRLSGFVLGLALCIKVVPLILIPSFWFCLSRVKRALFVISAILTFSLASLPYIAQQPLAIWRSVFSYAPTYGQWGLTLIAALVDRPMFAHGEYDPIGPHAAFATVLRIGTVLVVVVLSYHLNRRKKPDLFIQAGLILSLVLFVGPGFGIHYLVWLVPFVTVLGRNWTLAYYGVATLFLLRAYFCFGWTCLAAPSLAIHLGCWLLTLLLALRFYRLARNDLQ